MEETGDGTVGIVDRKIILTKVQHEHVDRLDGIMQKSKFALDMSPLGAGKTYTGAYMTGRFKYAITICPAKVEGKWNLVKTTYNLKKIKSIISYDVLRSTKGKQPKHEYLFRFDIDGVTEFHPTEKYLRMVKKGLLLIVDECHKLKNTSGQHHAVKALLKPICTEDGPSRALIISGSPVDEEEGVINLLRLTHVIRHRMLKVYHKDTRTLELYGAQELIDRAKELDPEGIEEFLMRFTMRSSNIDKMCYRIFQEVVKAKLTSSMPITHAVRYSDIYDGYYNLPKKDYEVLAKAITNLCNTVHYDPETGSVEYENKFSLGAITKNLMAIEASKLSTFARLAHDELNADPTVKVIISVNYKASITELKKIFKRLGHKCFVVQGSVKKEKREILFEEFQSQDLETRILIANTTTIAEGIDLDDKFGDRRRKLFVSPSYAILTLHQLSGRVARVDSESTASVRFVYGKCGVEEASILNALARKMKVMEETLQEQVEAGIKFPGSYDKKYEDDLAGLIPGEYPTYDIFKVNLGKFLDGGTGHFEKDDGGKESDDETNEFEKEFEEMKL